MAEHTKGPWRARGPVVLADNPDCPSTVIGVADCRTVDVSRAEAEANARLIAAAPATEEALEEVDVGIQIYMEKYGDNGGRLAGLRGLVIDTLARMGGG
jgi:hypothetical protein